MPFILCVQFVNLCLFGIDYSEITIINYSMLIVLQEESQVITISSSSYFTPPLEHQAGDL